MNTTAKISGALFGLLAVYWAWTNLNKKESAVPSFEEAVEVVTKAATNYKQTKPVAEVSTKIEPATLEPKSDLLPDGEYYLMTRVSQVTDTGIKGISAGEKVKKVREENGLFIITNGKVELPVKPDQLTNLKSYGSALAIQNAIPLEEPKVAPPPPPVVDEPKVNKRTGPDPRIAYYNKQISKKLAEINELENKALNSSSKVKAHQPIITRLRLEIAKLKAQKEALE